MSLELSLHSCIQLNSAWLTWQVTDLQTGVPYVHPRLSQSYIWLEFLVVPFLASSIFHHSAGDLIFLHLFIQLVTHPSVCMFTHLAIHHYTHAGIYPSVRPSVHPAIPPSLPLTRPLVIPYLCIVSSSRPVSFNASVRPLIFSFDHCKPGNISILAPYSGHLANYDLGDVIGYGSFGQVVAATRKADSLPVRSEQWSLEYASRGK